MSFLVLQEAHLTLRTSKGLTIAVRDNNDLKEEIKIDLSSTCSTCLSDNYNLSIPIIVCSEFSSQTEAIIDHKVRNNELYRIFVIVGSNVFPKWVINSFWTKFI